MRFQLASTNRSGRASSGAKCTRMEHYQVMNKHSSSSSRIVHYYDSDTSHKNSSCGGRLCETWIQVCDTMEKNTRIFLSVTHSLGRSVGRYIVMYRVYPPTLIYCVCSVQRDENWGGGGSRRRVKSPLDLWIHYALFKHISSSSFVPLSFPLSSPDDDHQGVKKWKKKKNYTKHSTTKKK